MNAVVDLLVRLNAHSSSPVDRDRAYTDSYRTIRLTVGVLGILLPIIFILGEAIFLGGGFGFRGSISAYFHSPMQDIFVGGLCIVGLLLATYLSGEPRSLDFRASLVAGIAVLGVVFFPTSRPELALGQPPCEASPTIPSCSFVERSLGEAHTAVVHAVCAIVFITGLAAMSLLFAAAEIVENRPEPPKIDKSWVFILHLCCAALIVLAGAWALVGTALHADWGPLTALYVGEVAAVWAFGISWLVAGIGVTAPPRIPGNGPLLAADAPAVPSTTDELQFARGSGSSAVIPPLTTT